MSLSFSLSSSSLKIFVDGVILGYVIAVPDITILSEWGELHGLDSVIGSQLSPRKHIAQGYLQILRGRSTGGAEGASLVADANNMVFRKYSTIQIMDTGTGGMLYNMYNCQIISQRWQMNPKGLVTGTLQFRSLIFEAG